jgi:periplasmic divalent cation tolerance protein
VEALSSLTVTGPDEATLASIGRTLVDEHLIACANIVPTIRSIYRWQGEVVDEPEAFALLHTTRERVQQVIDRIGKLHPYETSQTLSFVVTNAPADYAAWVNDVTTDPTEPTKG